MRVLLGGECIRKNANEVQDWGDLLLSCDFEDAQGVVNLNSTEALEDGLVEQKRYRLCIYYRDVSIMEGKFVKLNLLEDDSSTYKYCAKGYLTTLCAYFCAIYFLLETRIKIAFLQSKHYLLVVKVPYSQPQYNLSHGR